MGRKSILKPFKVINDGDMVGNLTSGSTDITNIDFITYIAQWSGTTPVGTLSAEVRQKTGTPPDGFSSEWVALDFGESIAVSGNTGAHTISVENKSFTEIRLKYARSSGTGTMQATIAGMVEGA